MAARRRTARTARRPPRRKIAGAKKGWAPPPGFSTVTPYLSVDGAAAAVAFYIKAFGAKELQRSTTPDGKIIHSRLKIGSSLVMLSDDFDPSRTEAAHARPEVPFTLHVYVQNVDDLWKRATEAGATIIMPIDDMFWGERYGQLKDPFGFRWSLSTPIKMSAAEKAEKQKAAMAMFEREERPTRDP